MRMGRLRAQRYSAPAPGDGEVGVVATAEEARTAVREAVQARRARSGLTFPMGVAGTRALRTESSSGFLLAVLAGTAGVALHIGLDGGVLGWVLTAIAGTISAIGLLVAYLAIPHNLRVARYHHLTTRVARRFNKAAERSRPGCGDAERVATFSRTIVEGSLYIAALGVVMLYRELAGDDALGQEIRERRDPVWPAWSYHLAVTAATSKKQPDGAAECTRALWEQTYATGHPVWATAAAVHILDALDERLHAERVQALIDWIHENGDQGVLTEALFYR